MGCVGVGPVEETPRLWNTVRPLPYLPPLAGLCASLQSSMGVFDPFQITAAMPNSTYLYASTYSVIPTRQLSHCMGQVRLNTNDMPQSENDEAAMARWLVCKDLPVVVFDPGTTSLR